MLRKNDESKKISEFILQIAWFILMLIVSICAFYQKAYLESIICGIFAVLSFLHIPIYIKGYKGSKNKKLFGAILEAILFPLMLAYSIYAFYQKEYLQCIFSCIFSVISFKEINIYIKAYKESKQ